jgi:TPR repeat protein
MAYAQGLGVRVNDSQAAKWLRQAAEQGECLAQNQLGLFYAQGKGTAQNLDEAMKWFKKAADQGFEPARRNWAFTAATRRHFLAKITTRSGKTYSGATLQKIDHDGITLQFAPESGGVGMAKLRFSELPQDLQQLLKCDDDKSSHPFPATQLLAAASQPL